MGPEILIAGDRAHRGELVPRVQDLGYTVVPVRARELVLRAQNPNPAAVIVCLGDADAGGLVQALRQRPETTGIPVLLYGRLQGETRDLAAVLELGADRFLEAPVDEVELKAALVELAGPPEVVARAEVRGEPPPTPRPGRADPALRRLHHTLEELAARLETHEESVDSHRDGIDLEAMGLDAVPDVDPEHDSGELELLREPTQRLPPTGEPRSSRRATRSDLTFSRGGEISPEARPQEPAAHSEHTASVATGAREDVRKDRATRWGEGRKGPGAGVGAGESELSQGTWPKRQRVAESGEARFAGGVSQGTGRSEREDEPGAARESEARREATVELTRGAWPRRGAELAQETGAGRAGSRRGDPTEGLPQELTQRTGARRGERPGAEPSPGEGTVELARGPRKMSETRTAERAGEDALGEESGLDAGRSAGRWSPAGAESTRGSGRAEESGARRLPRFATEDAGATTPAGPHGRRWRGAEASATDGEAPEMSQGTGLRRPASGGRFGGANEPAQDPGRGADETTVELRHSAWPKRALGQVEAAGDAAPGAIERDRGTWPKRQAPDEAGGREGWPRRDDGQAARGSEAERRAWPKGQVEDEADAPETGSRRRTARVEASGSTAQSRRGGEPAGEDNAASGSRPRRGTEAWPGEEDLRGQVERNTPEMAQGTWPKRLVMRDEAPGRRGGREATEDRPSAPGVAQGTWPKRLVTRDEAAVAEALPGRRGGREATEDLSRGAGPSRGFVALRERQRSEAPAAEAGEAPSPGDLSAAQVRGESDAPALLAELRRERFTGGLRVVAAGAPERRLWWSEGQVVGGASSAASESVLGRLAARGLLSPAHLELVARWGTGDSRRDVERLAQSALIKPQEMREALREPVRRIVERIAESGSVAWGLYPGEAPAVAVELGVPLAAMIAGGVQRGATLAQLRAAVTDARKPRLSFAGPEALAAELRWPAVSAIAERFDGQTPVGELVAAAVADEEVVRGVVYVLELLGHLAPEIDDPAASLSALDRQRVRERLRLARESDYFALLGLPREASRGEVLRAHADLTATFCESLEPDSRVELAEEIEELLAALDEARDVLSDDALHSAYLAQIGAL
ncbi:hypothetical protein [Nannocystis sp. SCPEA4]|uniref:hypothetical protein n=1 Tax=Nannocystis sp. SCPEA4 TaxID=2996787 RepID=UPI002271A837|nr:hypothetical protein [Nannocystis sp. SCPEA4]MCY1056077.1 hypothetical protein [Nannocystis sp. SCPEA4]